MTPAAFRTLALALDGASEGAHGGHPDFRSSAGKVFATMGYPDKGWAVVNLTPDRPDKAPGLGEPIAPGWHLCFLHSYARPRSLGRDGAAFEGGVLPKIPMPRRMYAGSTFTFDGDIPVGDKLRREIEFTDIQQREGGTGNLIVTTQTRRIFTPRGLALTEAASTVFREDPKSGAKSGVPVREAAPIDVPWRRTIAPDPVMLFRYSAITFNPHRIHYDRTYCQE